MQSPWITILTAPRQTIREIASTNPNRSIWVLALIHGVCSLMNVFQSLEAGQAMQTAGLLILVVLLAPFWGYLNFSIWSALTLWVGKILGGQGTFQTLRASYAWSTVPLLINIPLWLLMLALFGHQLFVNFSDTTQVPQSTVALLFGVLALKVIAAIWSLVIYIITLAEVQNFGIFKSIINMILAGILLAVIFFIVINIIGWML